MLVVAEDFSQVLHTKLLMLEIRLESDLILRHFEMGFSGELLL